jgi:hypothetical protein
MLVYPDLIWNREVGRPPTEKKFVQGCDVVSVYIHPCFLIDLRRKMKRDGRIEEP